MGAIDAAYPVESDYREKRITVHRHLNQTPSKWNDDDERTWEEVHALLKELDI